MRKLILQILVCIFIWFLFTIYKTYADYTVSDWQFWVAMASFAFLFHGAIEHYLKIIFRKK